MRQLFDVTGWFLWRTIYCGGRYVLDVSRVCNLALDAASARLASEKWRQHIVKHMRVISRMPAPAATTTTTDIPISVQNKVALETGILTFSAAILEGIVVLLDSKTTTT